MKQGELLAKIDELTNQLIKGKITPEAFRTQIDALKTQKRGGVFHAVEPEISGRILKLGLKEGAYLVVNGAVEYAPLREAKKDKEGNRKVGTLQFYYRTVKEE